MNQSIEEEQAMDQNESIEEEQAMDQNESIEKKQEKSKELLTIIEKQDDRIQKLQSTTFQLANFYFIFQGVIFTAITNGKSSLKCQQWWFPFSLSLIAAMLNLYALLSIAIKYKRSLHQQDLNWCYYEEIIAQQQEKEKEKEKIETTQQRIGKNSQDPFTQLLRKLYLLLCMGLLIGFSVLTLIGCWWIRCRESNQLKKLLGGGDDNCVKFCDGRKCLTLCLDY